MPDEALLGLDIQHWHIVQCSAVRWLAAAFGVKRALIERHSRLAVALGARHDMRAEVRQIRIGEVEAFSDHGCSHWWRGLALAGSITETCDPMKVRSEAFIILEAWCYFAV